MAEQPQTAPTRRKKSAKRRSRRKGASPFVIMAVIGVVFIIALVALQQISVASQTRNIGADARTLVKAGANPAVTIQVFSDFQ
jgi:flagellar basal body-associated protein FliL